MESRPEICSMPPLKWDVNNDGVYEICNPTHSRCASQAVVAAGGGWYLQWKVCVVKTIRVISLITGNHFNYLNPPALLPGWLWLSAAKNNLACQLCSLSWLWSLLITRKCNSSIGNYLGVSFSGVIPTNLPELHRTTETDWTWTATSSSTELICSSILYLLFPLDNVMKIKETNITISTGGIINIQLNK